MKNLNKAEQIEGSSETVILENSEVTGVQPKHLPKTKSGALSGAKRWLGYGLLIDKNDVEIKSIIDSIDKLQLKEGYKPNKTVGVATPLTEEEKAKKEAKLLKQLENLQKRQVISA